MAVVIFTGSFSVEPVQADDPPALIPYTLFHDFETGEKFAWEPYPYQQDMGYDALFFTRQSPTWNDSNYALARPIRANDTTELYHGFTRQLNMWTNERTRFQAKVFFQSDRSPETLEVALGTFDGRLYSHVIEEPEANEWIDLDIPLGAFSDDSGRSLRSGEHIQVVKLEASYPIVYYLFTYTMFMDNVQLTGDRQRRFVAEAPASVDFEEFDTSILKRHYVHGDVMSLRVSPEGNIGLDRVWARLLDSEGNVVRGNIVFERQDGAWVNDSIHRFSSSDARGQWTIELTGSRSERPDVEWSFDFLVPGEPVAGHPRLFFTRDELDERLAGLEDHPVASRILENAIEQSRRELDETDIEQQQEILRSPGGRHYGSDSVLKDVTAEGYGSTYLERATEALTGGPWSGWRERYGMWLNPMSALGSVIAEGSMLYAFTGDRQAGEKAKEALLRLASFEHWNHPWKIENRMHIYLYVGHVVKDVAYGYDMLHDLMSDQERTFVREALIEKGIKPFYRDMVEMNRMPSHSTNHIVRIIGGIGLAAVTLYGEDPENPYLEPWLSGILEKFHGFLTYNYGEDGGTGEPFIYQSHATGFTVELLASFERNFGVEWSTTTDAKDFYLYPLYAMDGEQKYADFGDGGHTYTMLNNLGWQWFSSRLEDPLLSWHVTRHWKAGEGGYLGWLWFRDDLEQQSRETLPTSHYIGMNGIHVMRSGWEDESTIISTRSGPHSNHFHYDQGTIRMITNNEDLLYDALYGGAYYENLEFPVYNIQAISKNVMLVDGDAESQKLADYYNDVAALSDWPRVRHSFTGEIADAVESDLATVYKGKLSEYRRTLLYTKEGPLFLFDRVESVSPDGHTYNWLFHAKDEDGEPTITYQVDDQQVRIDRPNARLTIDVVSPEIASSSIRQSDFDESFVTLDSEPNLSDATFLAILWPEARPESGSYGERPSTDRINQAGWIGARASHEGRTHYGLFRTDGSVSGSVSGFTTDASRFTATLDASGRLVRYYVEGSLFEGHGQSLSSGAPVTAAVLHHDGGTDVEVDASGSTRLSVSVSARPSRVSLDGSSVRYSYDNGRVSLQVPAGRHDIEMR